MDHVNTYAERVARGSPEETYRSTSAAPSGVPREEANSGPENTADDRPFKHSQYRVLSEFEKEHFHPLNVTPDRPCTAFFRAGSEISSKQIFDSLSSDGIPAKAVRCLQRKPTGETLITFTKVEYCCKFLDNSAFILRNRKYPTHPATGELTFLTIYDAPYEMPDAAIEERLKPFCTVYSRRRGRLQGYSDVANGLRHFRVQLKSSVPCYLRFGKFQLRFLHDGQTKTCRKCGAADHIARDCANDFCFNCDSIGHVSKRCPEKRKCCICKSELHMAIDCPLSWYRRPASHRDAAPEEAGTDPAARPEVDPGASSGTGMSSDPPRDFDESSPQPVNTGSDDLVSSVPAAIQYNFLNPDGLLRSETPQSNLPERPPTVAPSSGDTSLLNDLTLSGSDVDDSDVESDDGETDGAEFVDVDEAENVDEVECMDSSSIDQSAPSQRLDSLSAQEAIPLAAAVKKSLPQRRPVGHRNPSKLSSSLSGPFRKATAPLPVPSRRKHSSNSATGSSKSLDPENSPT